MEKRVNRPKARWQRGRRQGAVGARGGDGMVVVLGGGVVGGRQAKGSTER